jgi:hypothetical protein
VVARAPDEPDAFFAWSVIHGAATLRAGHVNAALGSVTDLSSSLVARVIRALA